MEIHLTLISTLTCVSILTVPEVRLQPSTILGMEKVGHNCYFLLRRECSRLTTKPDKKHIFLLNTTPLACWYNVLASYFSVFLKCHWVWGYQYRKFLIGYRRERKSLCSDPIANKTLQKPQCYAAFVKGPRWKSRNGKRAISGLRAFELSRKNMDAQV